MPCATFDRMADATLDFDHHFADNTSRFLAVASAATADDPTAMERTVPSCPDWSLADLVWHLGEVQDFWSHILSGQSADPSSYDRAERPDDQLLIGFLTDRLASLQAGLLRADTEPCWSWSPAGGTVAWVRRRQAQEALIHRVDAELTANDLSPVDEQLAIDGIDEMMEVMLGADALPDEATFSPDTGLIVLDCGSRRWPLETGHLTGSLADGRSLDDRAVRLLAPGEADASGTIDDANSATVNGSGAELLLWLWGRADRSGLQVAGNPNRADDLRSVAAEVTSG